jgi:HEAT repeat protein
MSDVFRMLTTSRGVPGACFMSPRRTTAALCAVVSLAIVGGARAASAGAIGAQPTSQILDVTVTSSRVSLTAREMPLGDVLKEIGRQARVKMVLRDDLNTSVTETLANVPVDEAVRRLSRWHSVVLIYDRTIDRPDDVMLTEVWVSNSPSGALRTDSAKQTGMGSQRSQAAAIDRRNAVSQVGNPQLAMALKQATSENGTKIIETLLRERAVPLDVKSLRRAAMGDPDPEVRRGAIKVLASLGSPNAVEAIRGTLLDPHSGVRSEANAALRRLGQARQGHE